jgi:hypothetical protein
MDRPWGRWLFWPLAAWLVAGAPCFSVVGEADAGWHLALGRLIAQSGLPTTNALTWTARDVPWYDTSWLWDLGTYALTARAGLLGLQLATFATFGVALWAMGWACGRAAWLVPAGAFLLLPRLAVRPHVATWAGFAVVLALCLAGEGRGALCRWLCVPIIAVAGNLHSGAPFAAALLGLWCAQEFWRTRRVSELIIAALGVAAVCANPGGLFNLRSLVWHLGVQQVVVIEEHLPPALRSEPVFFLLLPVALVLAWIKRRERPAYLAALVIFGALALRVSRMVYEFEILALPLVAGALLLLRARTQVLVAVALTLACAASHRADQIFRTRYGPEWNAEVQPVRAAAFARERGIEGRMFNAYVNGGYLEWAGFPAFVDGRVQCFPPGFFAAFYRASHGPAQFQTWLRSLDVEWAIPSRVSPWLSGRDLLDGPGWALVYWDDLSEVFLRRDVPRFAPLIAKLEYRFFQPHGAIVGAVEKLAPPDLPLLLREIDRFDSAAPGDPFALLVRCAALTRMSNPDAARICNQADGRVPPRLLAKARSLKP